MPNRDWEFYLDGQHYNLKIKHDPYITGRRRVFLDGELIYKGAKLIETGDDIHFNIGQHRMRIIIKVNQITTACKYDLYIDGMDIGSWNRHYNAQVEQARHQQQQQQQQQPPPAKQISTAPAASSAIPGSLEEELKKLARMKDDGLIDDDEYKLMKQKLIEKM